MNKQSIPLNRKNNRSFYPLINQHRLTLLITVFLFINFSGWAQISIKDLYEKMPNQDRFSNLLELRDYQKLKPEESAPYFLLGEIYEAYMLDTDPIRYFYYVETNYMQQKVYYQLAKAKLDKKQARQDREFFGDIPIISGNKKPELPDITNEINNRISRNETYFGFANMLYQNYVACINKYNQCLYDFREIIDLNPSYKDLYLLIDEELLKKVENIVTNFTAALENFEEYKHACTKIPEKVVIPSYSLRPIVTYRLEGLVESDFTQEVVELWDFGEWARQFLRIKKHEIDSIRTELYAADEKLDKQIEELESREIYKEEWDAYKPNQVFQNHMAKYDYASIGNKLLEYRESKVDFLTQMRSPINNPADSTQFFFINRLRFYNQLALNLTQLNNEVEQLKNETQIDNMKKYLNFFEERYGGFNGFTRWCVVEQYKNTENFNRNLKHFNHFIEQEQMPESNKYLKLCLDKDSIDLNYRPIADSCLRKDTLLIRYNKPFNNKWNLLSIQKINEDSIFSAQIGRYTRSGETVWYDVPQKPSVKGGTLHSFICNLTTAKDSCTHALYHFRMKKDSSQYCYNYAVHYNWEGDIVRQILLDSTAYPRFYKWDDINESYLLVTEGQSEKRESETADTTHIKRLNARGETIWENKSAGNGSFAGLIPSNSNYIIFTNNEITNNLQNTNSHPSGAVGIEYINHDGSIRWAKTIESDEPIGFQYLFKINSNTINALGRKGEGNNNLYVLLNMDGEIQFTNQTINEQTNTTNIE